MAVKDKGHRSVGLNPEEIFVVLFSIGSLQAFDPIGIAYFFGRVVPAFSNIKSETHFFNTDLNGLNIYISIG